MRLLRRVLRRPKLLLTIGLLVAIPVLGYTLATRDLGGSSPDAALRSNASSPLFAPPARQGLELFQEIPCRYLKETTEIYLSQGWTIHGVWVEAAYLLNDTDLLDSQCGLTVRPAPAQGPNA